MAGEVARAILERRGIAIPPSSSIADCLFAIASSRSLAPGARDWYEAIENADVSSLLEVIGRIESINYRGGEGASLRDAARTMVEHKLTERMVTTMEALEAVTTRLEKRAMFVGVVGVVATIVGTIATVASVYGGCGGNPG